jgi:hypothetical protein
VTITGSNFTSASTVKFKDVPSTNVTVVSPTQLTVTSPPGVAGTIDVTVTTEHGTSATGAMTKFTYAPPPTVTSVIPSGGPTAGGTTITISGTGFMEGSTSVSFAGTTASGVTVVSSTQLTAVLPPGATGTVPIKVMTPGGTSNAGNFTYIPRPTVGSVGPSSGPSTGGTQVTISGSGFTSDATVKFGDAAASGVTVSADGTRITAPSPAGTGTVDVTVTTQGGTSATSNGTKFTYEAVTQLAETGEGSSGLSPIVQALLGSLAFLIGLVALLWFPRRGCCLVKHAHIGGVLGMVALLASACSFPVAQNPFPGPSHSPQTTGVSPTVSSTLKASPLRGHIAYVRRAPTSGDPGVIWV